MKYEEHTAIGITGLLILSKIKILGLDVNIVSILTTGIASILADLDHLESRISNKMYSGISRAITNLLSLVIPTVLAVISYIQFNKWNNIYRSSTSSWNPFVVGLVVFAISNLLIREQYQVIKKIVAYGVAFGLIAYGIYKENRILISIGLFIGTYILTEHRSGVTHSILSAIITTLIVLKIDIKYNLNLTRYVLLGYLLHILSDCFTTRGCPIFFLL
ncbi:metal-dependent hydrolase [Caldisalinibacter kiritimatiensis]|uniref:Membrane-bound metal-dependent hydrolase n=1 Tax=Caldisalinibacter kiritimatiensis TaxID=1304284 RepID=R1CGP9_9FIRM|nr:metal-dependent hydrolase [Caldisalinibacter kiritimatiensis]EOD01465.1 hypothetical protein L21TH_0512 [Caldisalinibacter kiritimatiensis]